jgi:hypothetical protein
MLYRFYVYDEHVLIPTVAETEEGFYVDMKPVQLFAATSTEDWKSALYKALAAGNSLIPTPEQNEAGGSVLLESMNLQKWSAFEKRAVMYTIHAASAYVKIYRTGKGPDNMWNPAATEERMFDIRTPWQYVVDALVADAVKQPEAHPVKVGGLMVVPKN